jgi:hypothetical protein
MIIAYRDKEVGVFIAFRAPFRTYVTDFGKAVTESELQPHEIEETTIELRIKNARNYFD